MRAMILIKATADTEAGVMPRPEVFEEMGRYNEELVNAGILLAGEGLHPSSQGARVKTSGGKKTVVDGPFAETKELIAGFWIIEVKSLDEAVEWAKRVPTGPADAPDVELEVRRVFEAEDFGDAFPDEVKAKEDELRARIAEQHG